MSSSRKTNRPCESRGTSNKTLGHFLNAEDVVEIGVAVEEVGNKLYLETAKRVADKKLKQLFKKLADDEEEHIKTFRGMVQRSAKGKPPAGGTADRAHLRNLLKSNAFLNLEKAKTMFSDAREERAAVVLAIRFEKETMLLFHGMKEIVEDADLHIINGLIAEEKQHIADLSEYLHSIKSNTDSDTATG